MKALVAQRNVRADAEALRLFNAAAKGVSHTRPEVSVASSASVSGLADGTFCFAEAGHAAPRWRRSCAHALARRCRDDADWLAGGLADDGLVPHKIVAKGYDPVRADRPENVRCAVEARTHVPTKGH